VSVFFLPPASENEMFTHLHVHSHFSFGIGVSSPEALVEAAAGLGLSTLACTDTNGVYGAVEFQRACAAAGIRPILGAHLVADGQELVALAGDERGWGALCRAITRIHWAGSEAGTGVPAEESNGRSDLAVSIAQDRDGLILLSRDTGLLERVLGLSGPENLYGELRPGRGRHPVLAAARRLGLPVVATNGVIAARPEEWSRHRLLRAIALNTTLSALPAKEVWPTGAWLCSSAELARNFPDCPEALRAAAEVQERCAYAIPLNRIVPPRIADTLGAFDQLRALTL
jgi:error-prone DNA polymerase